MKKYIFRIIVFLAILIFIDRLSGYSLKYMIEHSKGGYIAHLNYITNNLSEDLLVFGSSRAIHHFNPQILSDSLNLSCHNCGINGNGILHFYGWLQLIKENKPPKVILYDITPSFDLLVGEDNHKYLGWLKMSYERANIRRIFEDIDTTEKYKMCSYLYRYNSKFLQIVADYFHPIRKIRDNGFRPLYGDANLMLIKDEKQDKLDSEVQFDPLKIRYINKFIDESVNLNLIFVVSPTWYGINKEELSPIRDICERRGIPFIDYSNDPKYVHNTYFFKDGLHLNSRGADEFTRDLVVRLGSYNHCYTINK